MAKKKEPSFDEALNIFNDVMQRASLTNYDYVNNILISKNDKGTVWIIPDRLICENVFSNNKELKEVSPTTEDGLNLIKITSLLNDIDSDDWIEIDPNVIYNGSIMNIFIDGFDYDIRINRNLIPLKLRKAEVNNIAYRLFNKENLILGLKKRFEYALPEMGFTLVRLFQIL